MYPVLLILHSVLRWLALGALVLALYRAFSGVSGKKVFSKADDSIRHWTATLFHIQLVLGMILYIKSPLVKYFWQNRSEAMNDLDVSFFGLYHPVGMLLAVVVLTIGSALAKRRATDAEKFNTMLYWFAAVLLIILVIIPWPFSPFANRPYIRIY